ncbi:hypothetical protein BC938DRAFT_479469 [Jimgerdemannia flammicorona]|uniref:Uncharacterized protein n=1 Tax=Jimgerdemannia flammicorona TaxID=994334 RepID=A0A433QXS7_9FUNG|nr:hypothetical protein BC938DRAFT_479469 [Jimgerdemannia flammicorona]
MFHRDDSLIICYLHHRGESCSISSSNRKNKSRKQDHTERKVIGRRGDAIRKSTSGRALEFGAAEVGRYYHGENGTKWLAESGLKLPKMLRLVLMIMVLDNPAGYVTRITKIDLFEIPEDVEIVLELIVSIFR